MTEFLTGKLDKRGKVCHLYMNESKRITSNATMNNILIPAFVKYFSAGAPLGSCILGKNKTKWVFAGKANILVALTKISDFFQVLEKNHRLLSTICQ